MLAALAVLAGLALLVYSVLTVVREGARRGTPTATPRPRPEIALNPDVGGAGTYISITGRHWTPDELVYIYLSPPLQREEAYAYEGALVGADGTFAVSILFPDDPKLLSRGTVAVVARSESGREAAAPFRIRVSPTATPAPTASPSPTKTPTPTPTAQPSPTSTAAPTQAATPTFTGWKGEYFQNPDLAGAPVMVRDDAAVDFRWRDGPPAPGLPPDDFSVRWSRTVQLAAGTYHFRVRADDGCRLWVDGSLLVDEWHEGAEAIYTADIYLPQETHEMVLEYFERTGVALASLTWEREDAFPNWKGEYFDNTTLTGQPYLVRDDDQVDFDWGQGAANQGLPDDGFSARWTRQWYFLQGDYRFYARAKDGVRVWFDEQLVIDEWHGGTDTTYAGDVQVSQEGNHTVRIEYYHQSGRAEIKVSWDHLVAYSGWKGEYFSNAELRGQPAFVRDDPDIRFEWGLGGPGALKDEFSVRWTRTVDFAGGNYRFTAVADDGIRVWVDTWKVIDEWHDGVRQTYTADFEGLSQGTHTITVEYYERAGEAVAQFWWTESVAQQGGVPE